MSAAIRKIQAAPNPDDIAIANMKAELSEETALNHTRSDFLFTRAATMDDWAEDRNPEFDAERNIMVHGGRAVGSSIHNG